MACRNTEKGQKVVDEIKAITGKDNSAHCMKLDLLSLAAVKQFADEFTAKYDRLHCLMNNAGVMNCPYGLSKDGMCHEHPAFSFRVDLMTQYLI